jgi:TP901 family phage tail tape measure protein
VADQEVIQIKLKIDTKEEAKIKALTGILGQQKELLKAYSEARDKAFSKQTISAYSKEIGVLKNAIDKSTTSIEKQQKSVFALGDSLGHVIAKIGLWTIGTGIVFGAISTLKKGIGTITEMDTQMVDLQKVFQGTSGELKSLKADLMDNSVAMGSLVDTTMRAAIELGRMGKTRAEIAELTKVSLLAQNIAEIDAGDATRYLNAAVLQFNKTANDALGILDEWNQLSNTTPSRTIDFAQAVEHAGAVIRQAGGEIEDLNAYVATLTATMAKSGNEIGQAMKTITTYAYRPKTVTKIEAITGIEVIDQKQDLMDIDVLLTKLAARWNTLTEAQQEELAQTIAGVRRKSFFLNLMQNFDLVLDAHAKQWVAAGSAMRENEIRMSSLKTKLDQLTAAMQQFAIQGGDAGILGAMKTMVDQLRNLMINLNSANGAIQLLAVAGIPLATAGFSVFIKRVIVAKAEVNGLAALLNTMSGKMIMWTAVIGGMVVGINALAKASKGSVANLRAQSEEIEKYLVNLRAAKERQQVIIDQYQLYRESYDALADLEKQNKDTTDAENNLHKILDEINKLNPEVVSSTDNHAKALRRLAEAASKAEKEITALNITDRDESIKSNKIAMQMQNNLRKRMVSKMLDLNYSPAITAFGGGIEGGALRTMADQDILGTKAREIEQQLGGATSNVAKIKILNTVIPNLRDELHRLNKESKYDPYDKRTKVLKEYVDNLVTVLNLLQESEELLHPSTKPKKSRQTGELPEDAETLKLKEKLADADEKHRLAMAQINERELEYWQERLRTGRNINDELDRQQIIYIIEELKAKHIVDLKDEQLDHEEKLAKIKDKELDEDDAQLSFIRRQLDLIEAKRVAQGGLLTQAQELRKLELQHQGEQIQAERQKNDIIEKRKILEREIRRIGESVKDAQIGIKAAQTRQVINPDFKLNQRGAYALQMIGDPFAEVREIQNQIASQIDAYNKLSGGRLGGFTYDSLGFNAEEILKSVGELKQQLSTLNPESIIDKDNLEQSLKVLDDMAKTAETLGTTQANIVSELQQQIINESLNKQRLQDEIGLKSEMQMINEQIRWVNENVTDEYLKQNNLLALQNQLGEIKKRRNQEMARGITDTLDSLIGNWQAGKSGREVGSEFFQGMGEVAGDYLGDMLGQQIGGMIGSTILPGIGGTLGSWLGEAVGKLFGYEDKKDEKVEATEDNTKALKENTQAFQDFQEQYYNAPTGFKLESAAKGGLPQFATGGTVERTGYAKVDKGEVVMKPSQIRDVIRERGSKTFTSNQLNNSQSLQVSFGNISIGDNTSISATQIKRVFKEAMNEQFAGGRQRFQHVSSSHQP